MSADNTIAIRITNDGRFAVNMEFVSCDYPNYASLTDSTAIFQFHHHAMKFAVSWILDDPYVEYGISDYARGDIRDPFETDEPQWDDEDWYDFYSREWDGDGDGPIVQEFDGDDSWGWFEEPYKVLSVGMVDPELERLLEEEEEIERSTREWHENQMADRYERNVLGL